MSDGAGGTAIGTVTVTIPNIAPAAADDTATTPYLTAVTVNVLANDTDGNSDPLTVTAVTGEAHGTAVITGTGVNTKVLYTPAAGWSGPDTMTYTISDGTTTSTAQLTVTTADGVPTAGSFSTHRPWRSADHDRRPRACERPQQRHVDGHRSRARFARDHHGQRQRRGRVHPRPDVRRARLLQLHRR